MFGLSKKKLILLLALIVVVGILFSLISYKIQISTDWQQRKMARTVQKQEDEFRRNEAELNVLAKQILDTAVQESGKCFIRLNHQPSVYCWVNLVYNENWQALLKTEEYRHCVEQGLVKELAPNWCIVIEYGY